VAREQKRGGNADLDVMRKDFLTAVGIAKEVAPYRHARLSYVKVSGGRSDGPEVPEGITNQEIRAKINSDIARLGFLPTKARPRSRSRSASGSPHGQRGAISAVD